MVALVVRDETRSGRVAISKFRCFLLQFYNATSMCVFLVVGGRRISRGDGVGVADGGGRGRCSLLEIKLHVPVAVGVRVHRHRYVVRCVV